MKLAFYDTMKYPVPTQDHFFHYNDHISTKKHTHKEIRIKEDFSRPEKDPLMDEYINHIKQHTKLFRSLPFISEIYLCNSITFNKLNKNSDIDLFIITKKNSIWKARFFSLLMFWFKWLKVWKKKKAKKFCLSFYISEDHTDIYNISLKKTDIYLAYWLAHLVPLYQEQKHETSIYKHNKRLNSLLPNFPNKSIIQIWIDTIQWNTKTKDRLEYFLWRSLFWLTWKAIEILIKAIRYPILIIKKKIVWNAWKNIIISDNMLKFHKDIRKKIRLLFLNQSKKNK